MDGDPLDSHLLQACQYLEWGQDPWENVGVCFFLMEVGRRRYFLVDVLSDIGKASQQQSHQGKHLSTFTKWSIMFSLWQLRGMSARNRSLNLAGLAHPLGVSPWILLLLLTGLKEGRGILFPLCSWSHYRRVTRRQDYFHKPMLKDKNENSPCQRITKFIELWSTSFSESCRPQSTCSWSTAVWWGLLEP